MRQALRSGAESRRDAGHLKTSPKETLRGEIKKRLNGAPDGQFHLQGAAAASFLRSSPLWRRYNTVFLFLSMKSEIDTGPLLENALQDGKRIFAPKVEAERLAFYPVFSVEGPWRKGPFGIREPAEAPEFPGRLNQTEAKDFPALILSPGLAFDRGGNRLGRGGGYYDRFFAELDARGLEYFALGLCMDFQLVKKVPSGENDKRMNGLVTGKEFIILTG